MEHKTFNPEFKLSDAGSGEVAGYASTFHNWDSVNERPVKGAFARHLPDFLKDGFISVGHDWASLPIASPVEAFEDDHGLFVRASFHSTPAAQAARTVIKERLDRQKSVKLSIGYEVLDDEYTQEGRLLKDVKLYEYSFVTVPANSLASVTDAKGLPLIDHSQAVLAAVDELKTRLVGLRDLRMKEGRVLSEANRKRIGGLLEALAAVTDDLNALLSATEPKADVDKAKALYIEFQRIQAQLNGVSL